LKPGESIWEVREGYFKNAWVDDSQWLRLLMPVWGLPFQTLYVAFGLWGFWDRFFSNQISPWDVPKYVVGGAPVIGLWCLLAGWLFLAVRAWRKPSVIEASPEGFVYEEPCSFRGQVWLRAGDVESVGVDNVQGVLFYRRWCLRIDLRTPPGRFGLRRRAWRFFRSESRSSLEPLAAAIRRAMGKPGPDGLVGR
jgi:hypothetical protein